MGAAWLGLRQVNVYFESTYTWLITASQHFPYLPSHNLLTFFVLLLPSGYGVIALSVCTHDTGCAVTIYGVTVC